MNQREGRRDNLAIPYRWENTANISDGLIGGIFLAFKIPLKREFHERIKLENRFLLSTVFGICKIKNIDLGLWIDLTNTTRFYDYKDMPLSCKYKKFSVDYKQPPSSDEVRSFIHLVGTYLTKYPNKKVGVHCLLGHNQTGYLIVSYLIKKLGYSLVDAMKEFSTFRPPGIIDRAHITSLYETYDTIENMPNFMNSSYKKKYSENVCNNALASDLTENMKKLNLIDKGYCVKFMEGVPNVTEIIQEKEQTKIRDEMRAMCKYKYVGFPGTFPVSLKVEHLIQFNENVYLVTHKPVGVRYLMLINDKNVYFADINFNIFSISGLTFPRKDALNTLIKDTLLDGLMVMDTIDGEKCPTFYITDIIYLNGLYVGDKPLFPERIMLVKNEIIAPRELLSQKGQLDYIKEPCGVTLKQYYGINQLEMILSENFSKLLNHEFEGVIFVSAQKPYAVRNNESIFKWQPSNKVDIKFKLKITVSEIKGFLGKICELYVQKLETPFALMQYTDSVKDLNGKIIACHLENNEWKFSKERNDRAYPNSLRTAKDICTALQQNIKEKDLLDYVKKYGLVLN